MSWIKERELMKPYVKAIEDAVNDAEKFSNEMGISFSIEIADGVSGNYTPPKAGYTKEQVLAMIEDGSYKNLSDMRKEEADYVIKMTEEDDPWNSSNEEYPEGWRGSSDNY